MPVLPNRQHQKIFRGRAVLPNHLGSNYLIDIITSLTISEVVRGVTKETIFYIEKKRKRKQSRVSTIATYRYCHYHINLLYVIIISHYINYLLSPSCFLLFSPHSFHYFRFFSFDIVDSLSLCRWLLK